jgi:glyoxylase-like metal-dependent hydrolase (beta-lactamase superfamily II)
MKSNLTCCLAVGIAVVGCCAASAESRVPAWDARGVGLLPPQGIASLDVAADGSRIAIGTFASPGDPDVFVFDGNGRFVRSHIVGQRAINQVSLNGREGLHAICTMPDGRAGDGPTVYFCGDNVTAIPNNLGEPGYPRTIFHYGDHSNHTGVQLGSTSAGNVVLYGNQVLWLAESGQQPRFTVELPWSNEAVSTVVATHSSGAAVAGFAVLKSTTAPPHANLFLSYPDEKLPRWKRPALNDVGRCESAEQGLYGAPTLRDGTREELPQHDLPVVGPLSLAVNRGQALTRVASADYPGWQRWIRSSATGREQNYGTRFMPAAATVSVYDAEGRLIRGFGPDKFNKAGWLDLEFLPGDRLLLAFPHHWTCRGLAGQPHLPVDDDARTAWLLDIDSGETNALDFPDAIAAAAAGDDGRIAISCWNGMLYLLSADDFRSGKLPAGIDVGGPALIRSRLRGAGWVVAGSRGRIQFLDASGNVTSQFELSDGIHNLRESQPWIANARAERINEGLWQLPGGRVESDLGGQWVIEGREGLILIEGHAGLSFERERRAMRAVGLDPDQVKYVLTTHEHGDHSPGAYLWRVTTGAKFVCSEEMAYTLQHHIPQSTGYGLHPPVPTDIRIRADQELDLCGIKVRAVRLPGHTFGSMGWLVERGGRKYVAIGDLIMPDGVLGYAGSINFSASDVLSSLRKLDALGVDYILPGHGPITSPERYLAAGIGVGRHVGWGKMRPEAPDPRYRLKQANVVVAAWNLDATSADFGDFNADGLPDVAVVASQGEGSIIKLFLNQRGRFADQPDVELPVPGVQDPSKLRVGELNGDGRLDLFVGGRSSAVLLSSGRFPGFETTALSLGEGNHARRVELSGDGQADIVVNAKFGTFAKVGPRMNGFAHTQEIMPRVTGPYLDLRSTDLNGDGRSDLIFSYGQVFLRAGDGKLPTEPTLQLPASRDRDWCYFGVGDFNGDKRIDLAFCTAPQEVPAASVFYNTGNAAAPFALTPNQTIDLADPAGAKTNQRPYLRDSVAVADWNGDGIDDLVIGKGQHNAILIVPGSPRGLDDARRTRIALDYSIHYETGLFVGDFNGDGRADIACLGYTNTGVGAGGPLAVYVYLQQQ